ncbi:gastric triacylglycerol lipase-like [Plodia interpunctella]|uniref:gastric triacylglycerol lipase-like n=1 Tax=Plodia interpunctella TaxID=58824 RepID=UPI0023687A58|nr:gastric triacylglycerol lipase-like [Plodia interpunctella]
MILLQIIPTLISLHVARANIVQVVESKLNAETAKSSLVNFTELFGYSPRTNLNFTELVKYDGYLSESHYVTTSDGYILALYRIPLKDSCPQNSSKLPILFTHGLYLSGDDCIIPGPGKAHCYIYADNCYDVWVPNNRGNRYSRNHTTLNPDKDAVFWNFAWDDMATKDLPAIIDYILDITGKEQLSFIGHSQGVSNLILLCAEQPKYNTKINVGFGLSTTAWLDHSRFIGIFLEAVLSVFADEFNNATNIEILANGGLFQTAGNFLCGFSDVEYPFCTFLLFSVLGFNKFNIKPDVLKVLPGHVPAGTSLKDFIRWGQIRKNGFTKYDYGIKGNLVKYGEKIPPEFDLSAVSMKWVFLASLNDFVGDPRDQKKLVNVLSNAEMCILEDKLFGHLDFLYADSIPELITPKILSYFETGSYKCGTDLASTI